MRTHYYFVDESGDLAVRGRRGRSLLGTPGVSRCFMVGVAHIRDLSRVTSRVNKLRAALLADPELRNIPSMQPERGKTAKYFHAKDDCSAVRAAMFQLLGSQDISVKVGIRRKACIRGERENDVYDNMVKTLFKGLLHKGNSEIWFAQRGKSSREEALRDAIERARINFERDTGIATERTVHVISSVPSETVGLQVIDYYLWAVQRLYERADGHAYRRMADRYSVIMDFDDKRSGKSYGTWYTRSNPLDLKKMLPPAG